MITNLQPAGYSMGRELGGMGRIRPSAVVRLRADDDCQPWTGVPPVMRREVVSLVMAAAVVVVDGLVLAGVIGPGWPPSVWVSGCILLAGCVCIWYSESYLVSIRMPVMGLTVSLGGILVVLALGLGHGVARNAAGGAGPTTSVQASPPTPVAGKQDSAGPDWLLVWTAVGAVGSLLAGIAGFVVAVRRN